MSASKPGRTFPDLRPGEHLCCIYQSEQEHRAVLTPFLQQGLERGEKVLYIVDAHTSDAILAYLREAGVDVAACLASGQLGILTRQDAYLRDGRFDPARMIELLEQTTSQAIAEGWSALRVTGEMTWALRGEPGSDRLMEYEARLNEYFPGSRCLAICQYDRRRFSPELLLDVLCTHPTVLIGEEAIPNVFYLPPRAFLTDGATGRFDQWVSALVQHHHAREERARSEEQFLAFAEAADQVFWITDLDPERVGYVNAAFERIWGRSAAELKADPRVWVASILPEDRPQVEAAFERWVRGAPDAGYEVLYRIVRPDGVVRTIADRGCVLARDGGRVTRVGGIAEDVTERVAMERALRESEARARRQLETILSPTIDPGALELADIIDVPRVQALMDAFYQLTRVGIGIIDLHGNVLVGTGWQDICTKFHRVHPETRRLCIESDLEHHHHATPGSFTLYRCKNNMWDMATPIVLGDRHVGNIFLGQFLFDTEVPDYAVFRDQARRYGFDETAYLAALDRVPRWSEAHVNAAMSFYASLAAMLGDLSLGNIRLAHAAEQERRGEATLRRLNRDLGAIRSCNQALLRATDEEALLGEVCRIVCDEAGYRFAAVVYAIPDPARGVRPIAWAGVEAGYIEAADISWAETERGMGPAGTAIRTGATSYVQDYATDPRMGPWRDLVLERGFRSGIGLPLRDESAGAFGALLIHASEVNAFTPDEVRLLEELAGDLAFGIGVVRARAERRQALAALERQGADLREAQRVGRLGGWEWDARSDALTRSPELCAMLHSEVGPRTLELAEFLASYAPESAVRFDEAVKRTLATGEPYEIDLAVALGEGSPRWVMARGEPMRAEEGRIVGVRGTVQDITDRKLSERALRASQEKFAAAFHASPDLMAVTRADGTILEVNEAYTRLLGHAQGESIGRTTGELSIWADQADRAEFVARLQEFGEVHDFETRLRCKDGSVRTCLDSARTIDIDGEPCILSVVHDITGRKATEAALRASQQRLSAFNRIANVFLTVPDDGTYYWVLTIVQELLESPMGVFGLVNEDGDLEVPAFVGAADATRRSAAGTTVLPRALWGEEGWTRAIVEGRTVSSPGPFRAPDGTVTHAAFLATPIVLGTRPIGLVCVAGRTADYSADGRELLEGLGQFVAPVVHARLERRGQERRRASAEAALRESEGRHRALFEHSPAGIYRSTVGGRLLQVNDAFAQVLGYGSPEEVVPVSADRLYVDPGERDCFLARLRTDGTVGSLSTELRRKDGTSLWVVESASLAPDATGTLTVVEGTIIDITARKLLEDRMRGLVAAIEQAAETIVITDREGTIRYANPAFERVTGYTVAEALGQNPRILKSGQHTPEFYGQMWATLLGGEVWHGRLTNRRKDGALFEEDATISPVRDESGALTGFVAVKRDVTQEMELEAQLRHSQKIEAIGRLAGGIAHDFNNLLQAMLSQTQLLRVLPDRLERGLADLEAHIRRGGALARQLLLFSRREVVRRERLDLNEVMAAAATLIRRLVRENVELRVVPSGPAVNVEADRGQIEQVLMNLVVNAVDAMPDGGRLTLRTGQTPEFSWFAVEDTGCGMPEEIREKVFEPFFTTKSAGHGTGLGLSVVHGIVAQHGGRVQLDSTEGVGSTFRVMLPRVSSGEFPAVGSTQMDEKQPTGHGERVLVVEDEPAAREALEEILRSLGYEVTAVGCGGDAGVLPSAPAYDALLTDLMLPDVNGADLSRALRDRWPALKVVLMSGYNEADSAGSIARLGTAEYLQKPFGIGALARALRRALTRTQEPVNTSEG